MKSEFEHSWLTHEYFFTVCWNQDPNKIHEQQLVHIFFTSTLLRDLPFPSPFSSFFAFFLSFFSPSLSLLQFICWKKNPQDHFHVAVYFLTFMGSKTLQVLKSLRISTPHHRLRQNNFLDEFQCYWVNYFVVL